MAGTSLVQEDGSKTYRRIVSSASRGEMEELIKEGAPRETVEYKEVEEVLPDGTIHTTQRTVHHKVKHVHRSLTSQSGEEEVYESDEAVPGSEKEDVLEMYDQPAKMIHEEEDIEQELPDGTKVKKHVVMNRMVHLIKMHHESFDEAGQKQEEDYDLEEVIPGTESAFVAGVDSDYEEEMEEKRKRKASGDQPAANTQGATDFPTPQNLAYQHGVSEVDAGFRTMGAEEYTEEAGRYGSEETRGQRIVQQTMGVVNQMLAAGELQLEHETTTVLAAEGWESEGTPVITITEDLSTPPDEDEDVPSYFGIKYEASSEGDIVEGATGGGDNDEEMQSHRVVMKKEVHKKTILKADGQEETTIREDSVVHQDSEPPEELRDSMQQIINQFMEANPEVPTLPIEATEEADEGTEV